MKLLSPTHLLTAAAILAAANASFAEVINVDIQGSGSGGAASVANYTGASANGPIASGTTWNHFTVGGNPPNGDFLLDLNDDSGTPTTVDVTFGTGWLGSFADGAPNNLQGDRVFTSGGVTGDITIGGLTPSGAYSIALIAAVNGASAFSSDFTIGGTTLTATGATGAGTNANGPLTFTAGVTHVLFSNIIADGSGNITFSMKNTTGAANGVLSGLQIESAVADVTDPLVSTLDPADDATGVATYSDLVVTFDENVAFGTGNITIKETAGDAILEVFDVTTSPNLLLSGASVTINPGSNLAGSTGYYVQIDADAIDDLAGNSFAGITDTTSWSFTTAAADVTDPVVSTLDPADDANGVVVSSSLSVTFDENVAFGTGNITIKESVGDAVVEAFDVTSSSNLSLSGATVTIDPTSDLSGSTGYYVEIDATAIDDISGNSFAGLGGNATWNFVTGINPLTPFTGGDVAEGLDLSGTIVHAFNLGGPTLTVQGVNFTAAPRATPPAGITTTVGFEFNYFAANGSKTGANYGATADDDALETLTTTVWYDENWSFDLDVTPGNDYELLLIFQESYFANQGTTNRNFDISVETATPSTLTLTVDDLDLGTATDGAAPAQPGPDFGVVYTYTFTAPDGSFRVALDDSPAGADPNAILAAVVLKSLTADVTPPNIASLNPADDATVGVGVDDNLSVTFDELIAFGTGDITLRTGAGALVEAFDVTSSPNLVLAGNTVTIDPTSDLSAPGDYYVEIASTAIEDTSGNSFAGINDATTWNFSTDATAPGVGTIDIPTNGASDVPVGSSLALTFDENMQKGTGNILIKRVSDDGVVDTIDVNSANVVISGGQVTILPTAGLPSLTELYIEIEAGAFEDLAGNSFAGISGSGTWSFTTGEVVLFDDFSTDPDLGTEWTEYGYLSPDLTTVTWNSGDGDLDLSKPSSSPYNGLGLYRIGAQRTATDPVTLTVKAYDRTSGTWGFTGLMISAAQTQDYLTSTDDSYSFLLSSVAGAASAGNVTLQVRRTYADGTADFVLYQGLEFDIASTGPVTLDIARDGAHYRFLANDVEVYTTAVPAAGDTYDTAAKDSLVNFQIVLAGDSAITVTVDDFGVGGVTFDPLVLEIAASGGALDFSWNSLPGMQYDLLSSDDPEAEPDPSLWTPYFDGVTTWENIPSTGTTTMVTGVLKDGPVRFFALFEEEIPPLMSEDFEGGIGDFTVFDHSAGATGTDWTQGAPTSGSAGAPNPGGFVDSGNGASTNCIGTDIGTPGFHTADTDTCLRSGIIDLTGVAAATLSFAEALDVESADTAVVNIIDDTTDAIISAAIYTATDGNNAAATWASVAPIAIPGVALGQAVRIEWRFTGAGAPGSDYMGWYIDDVVVVETTP